MGGRRLTTGLAAATRTFGKPIDMRRLKRTVSWKLDIAARQRDLATSLRGERLDLEACPICRERTYALFVEVFEYPYCQCAACGHIFCQRPPRPEAVRRLYASAEGKAEAISADIYAVKELFATRVDTVAAPKVRFVSLRTGERGKWLDVGCGAGDVLFAANAEGWHAVGLESDPAQVRFARAMGLDVEQIFVDPATIGRYVGDAAIVSLINVVEHVLLPDELLRRVADAMRPGARVVVEVPRHPSLSSFAIRTFPEFAARHIYPPDHLHIFTERSMDRLLTDNGLVAEHVWLFGQDFYETVSSMAAQGGFGESAEFDGLLSAASAVQDAIDHTSLSDTMLVIARRHG
jgi:SAM-dependent methyltransferase